MPGKLPLNLDMGGGGGRKKPSLLSLHPSRSITPAARVSAAGLHTLQARLPRDGLVPPEKTHPLGGNDNV